MTNLVPQPNDDGVKEFEREIAQLAPATRRRILEKFVLAALGSIPWVGGFIAAAASLRTESGELRQNALQSEWLKEHERKIAELRKTLGEIDARFQSLGETIDERLQSEEYLDLVKKAFRLWDAAETAEKRGYAANVVVNSAGTRVCSDVSVRAWPY